MGGCCCSSRRAELNRGGAGYQHCPCAPVEQDPFSLRHRFSAVSTDALVDTHLETSESEIFQAPPLPSLRFPNTSQDDLHLSGNTVGRHTLEEQSVRDAVTVAREDLKGSEIKSLNQCFAESPKHSGEKNSKLNEPISVEKDEEDVCPTCLEEYDKENPKIITNCRHHFHLSCILEWMERSNNCAVCNQPILLYLYWLLMPAYDVQGASKLIVAPGLTTERNMDTFSEMQIHVNMVLVVVSFTEADTTIQDSEKLLADVAIFPLCIHPSGQEHHLL